MVKENASVSDVWTSNTIKLAVILHCCCHIKMLLLALTLTIALRTKTLKVSEITKHVKKPIPYKFLLPDQLPCVIPKCCD